jgi:trimeric autotransporter adhesin
MRKLSHPGRIILRVSMIAICIVILCKNNTLNAQNVAITDNESYTAENSAMLDVMSTNKGMLVPRLTGAQRTGIVSPATGLMVYDIDVKSFMYYNGVTWITIPQLATSAGTGESLFAVVNHLGDTVFAVYHDGVRIFVDPEAKGKVGGFAISGRTPTKAGEKVEYFRVTPDSTRIYVNDSVGTKGKVGGFAISGRTPTKTGVKEYFTINKDSTRIYIDSTTSKGKVGGFAISGRTPTKGGTAKFMDMTKENYFIGHQSGQQTTDGKYNSFMGYESGFSNVSGSNNSFIGYRTGYNNLSGNNNTFLGDSSGFGNTTGSGNLFVGKNSGITNTAGSYNSFIGYASGYHNTTGVNNSFLGSYSGYSNTYGNNNSFVGESAGYNNISGSGNSFIGIDAGNKNKYGNYNSYLGYQTGNNNISGNYNVFLGYQSGFTNTSSNNSFIGYKSGYSNSSGYSNVFIGNNSGYSNTSGWDNVFIGYHAGMNHLSNNYNVYIGSQAGELDSLGHHNVFVGFHAGQFNKIGERNVFVGDGAGTDNNSGQQNVFIGFSAGNNHTGNDYNVYIGSEAGTGDLTGHENVFIGYHAGANNLSGQRNVYLGGGAGMFGTASNRNVFVGFCTGQHATGSYNVFLGQYAGENETGSNKLYIENSNSSNPLIYGEFDNNILTFNTNNVSVTDDFPVLDIKTNLTSGTDAILRIGGARTTSSTDDLSRIEFYNYESGGPFELGRITARNSDATSGTSNGDLVFKVNNGSTLVDRLKIKYNGYVGIGSSNPSWRLQVGETSNYGWVASNGSWQSSSDIKYKENIRALDSGLDKVLKMNGVYFNVIGDDPVKDKQVGFIAQEMEEILPEVVSTDSNGLKGISYSRITPVLVEAIKEQQKQIKILEAHNNQLKSELEAIKAELSRQK